MTHKSIETTHSVVIIGYSKLKCMKFCRQKFFSDVVHKMFIIKFTYFCIQTSVCSAFSIFVVLSDKKPEHSFVLRLKLKIGQTGTDLPLSLAHMVALKARTRNSGLPTMALPENISRTPYTWSEHTD